MLPPTSIKQLYPLLKEMQARPALWTGELSLQSIRTYLDGYTMALHQNKLLAITGEPNFHDWVAHKLGFYESTAGWHNMILAITLGFNPKQIEWEDYAKEATKKQQLQAIQHFYELLEIFMEA